MTGKSLFYFHNVIVEGGFNLPIQLNEKSGRFFGKASWRRVDDVSRTMSTELRSGSDGSRILDGMPQENEP